MFFQFLFKRLILVICLMDPGIVFWSLKPELNVLLNDKLADAEGGWRLFQWQVQHLCLLKLWKLSPPNNMSLLTKVTVSCAHSKDIIFSSLNNGLLQVINFEWVRIFIVLFCSWNVILMHGEFPKKILSQLMWEYVLAKYAHSAVY